MKKPSAYQTALWAAIIFSSTIAFFAVVASVPSISVRVDFYKSPWSEIVTVLVWVATIASLVLLIFVPRVILMMVRKLETRHLAPLLVSLVGACVLGLWVWAIVDLLHYG